MSERTYWTGYGLTDPLHLDGICPCISPPWHSHPLGYQDLLLGCPPRGVDVEGCLRLIQLLSDGRNEMTRTGMTTTVMGWTLYANVDITTGRYSPS